VPLQPVRGEHLVPVVPDPAPGPAVSPAAGQTHRVGVGRSEERLGRGGTPVDQQPAARGVGETESTDVHGLGVVRADHVPEAQVQAEATQGPQARGQPVDLRVPVHRLLARPAGRPARGIESFGQGGDRVLEALRDDREVSFVAGDQRRVGLLVQVIRQVERAGGQGVFRRRQVPHLHIAPSLVLVTVGDCAAWQGSCRKPPGGLYVESGRERDSFPLLVSRGVSCRWPASRQ
jgi:hypothetical protein